MVFCQTTTLQNDLKFGLTFMEIFFFTFFLMSGGWNKGSFYCQLVYSLTIYERYWTWVGPIYRFVLHNFPSGTGLFICTEHALFQKSTFQKFLIPLMQFQFPDPSHPGNSCVSQHTAPSGFEMKLGYLPTPIWN